MPSTTPAFRLFSLDADGSLRDRAAIVRRLGAIS